MNPLKDKTVLITGASSGIGEALAVEFASCGANLILLARRRERLESLAQDLASKFSSQKIWVCVADVTSNESMSQALSEVISKTGSIDIVVANAGFGVAGDVEKLSIEDYQRQFETNVFGVLRTVKETLPSLVESRGRLAIVGSVNGYVALPGISAYAMSKFSVRALCDALYHELRPQGISVTNIAPGLVVSEIRRVNNRGEFKTNSKDPIPMWLQMESSVAAKKIVRAILLRKRERVVTAHGWWIVRLQRFFPAVVCFLIRIFKVKARVEPTV